MEDYKLAEILKNDFKLKKKLFESEREFIERCCNDMMRSLTGTTHRIVDSFDAYLERGLIKIAYSTVNLKRKLFESERDYKKRCLQELKRSYGTEDERLLLISLYSNRKYPDSTRTRKKRDYRDNEYEQIRAEQENERMKAWGYPVESGSCPHLLRIEMGYYESWNCYRCEVTGGTFDDDYCRNMCYYEEKYRHCMCNQ